MQQIPVSSSLIRSAAYDSERHELAVTFASGATWIYGNASQPFTSEDAMAFAGAGSKGQWFLGNIKGQWPERRI